MLVQQQQQREVRESVSPCFHAIRGSGNRSKSKDHLQCLKLVKYHCTTPQQTANKSALSETTGLVQPWLGAAPLDALGVAERFPGDLGLPGSTTFVLLDPVPFTHSKRQMATSNADAEAASFASRTGQSMLPAVIAKAAPSLSSSVVSVLAADASKIHYMSTTRRICQNLNQLIKISSCMHSDSQAGPHL